MTPAESDLTPARRRTLDAALALLYPEEKSG